MTTKQPGIEKEMQPKPVAEDPNYQSASKLKNKVAIITGGDSGIGKAVAIAFAKEGASIVISYLNEHEDATETKKLIDSLNVPCIIMPGDIGEEEICQKLATTAIEQFGHIDLLVNNAGEQHVQENFQDITRNQLERTFRTNIFSFFYLTKAVLPHLKPGCAIINSTSVTAYKGNKELIDYAATKGAIVAFTRSLALALVERDIRVNAVAPGPVWTPLITASFDAEKIEHFGEQTPMQRAAQPDEIAPCYVFLASKDSSYMTGQVLHPNGGTIVNA